MTNIVTSEGDNAYTRVGGWRGAQPGIGIVQTSNALLARWTARASSTIDRTRVDKYNKIGILIDGAQNDAAPFIPSGAVNWGVITASQIIGRTSASTTPAPAAAPTSACSRPGRCSARTACA